SVIIPVYNEESTVHEVIERVKALPYDKEIIVVDDGSTDATASQLSEANDHPVVTVFTSPVNFGKGAAVRIGLAHATGDVVAIQDADLELSPEEFPRLLDPILSGEADVVYGSRFLRGRGRVSLVTYLANRLLAFWVNLLYGSRLTDEATAYKVFRASVIQRLPLGCVGFEFCPEVTAKLLRSGHSITEVPIGYHPRSPSEGKKVSYLRDGLKAAWTLLRLRFWRPSSPAAEAPTVSACQGCGFGGVAPGSNDSRPHGDLPR
ncbi:MAG: glycosyltransferase family 2 protein, partial [Armatimonadota bacterium]